MYLYNKIFKIKIDNVIFKIYYITRNIKWLSILLIKTKILVKLWKYKNLINNFTRQKEKKNNNERERYHKLNKYYLINF